MRGRILPDRAARGRRTSGHEEQQESATEVEREGQSAPPEGETEGGDLEATDEEVHVTNEAEGEARDSGKRGEIIASQKKPRKSLCVSTSIVRRMTAEQLRKHKGTWQMDG